MMPAATQPANHAGTVVFVRALRAGRGKEPPRPFPTLSAPPVLRLKAVCDIIPGTQVASITLSQGACVTHFLTLQSVDAVLAHIQSFSVLGTEDIPLHLCLGRVLAAPFLAPEDLPGFARSTMDGFAVRARDVFGASEGSPALLDYLGECAMGEVPSLAIGAGQTARIWTGGMLPEGADAVVMLEYSRQVGPAQMELTRPVAPGDHMIGKDEDAHKGQELLPAGRVLRAQELGLLAALGQAVVRVRRKPRVGVISSGDEVVPCHAVPLPGQVRDINSTTLTALAVSAGAEGRYIGLAGDDQEALRRMVDEALSWADVVLLSGGSSAGQRDYTLKVLACIPGSEILAHGVAISPGKPLIFARVGQKALWGMPGHAASALVCAEVFIRPLLARLLGCSGEAPAWHGQMRARLTRPVASAQGRRDYIRVALERPQPGEPAESLMWARPIMGKSGLITPLVMAEGLVVCPESQEGLDAGQVVDVQLLL